MSSVGPGLSIDARRHFLHALRRVLRPIIRLLIRHGVRYDQFADVARRAYVESAAQGGSERSAIPTRDDIALVTGISRQRVDHYIEDECDLPVALSSQSAQIASVLHKWHTDPRYLDADGAPLELEFDGASGPTFKTLVAQVDADLNPNFMLNELLTAKCVIDSDETRFRVTTRSFIWGTGLPYGIEYFGTALGHLIQTHEYNANPENAENKRLERFVSADQGLPAALLPSFHAFAKERADKFLLDLDDWLAGFSGPDAGPECPLIQTGVNVFFYVEAPPDLKALSEFVQPSRHAPAHRSAS